MVSRLELHARHLMSIKHEAFARESEVSSSARLPRGTAVIQLHLLQLFRLLILTLEPVLTKPQRCRSTTPVSRKGTSPAASKAGGAMCRDVYYNYRKEQSDLGLGGAPSLARSTPRGTRGRLDAADTCLPNDRGVQAWPASAARSGRAASCVRACAAPVVDERRRMNPE
eukprot:6184729-Pleurochrysis_carterae.AAC.1